MVTFLTDIMGSWTVTVTFFESAFLFFVKVASDVRISLDHQRKKELSVPCQKEQLTFEFGVCDISLLISKTHWSYKSLLYDSGVSISHFWDKSEL